jgi:antirestriction protein ArdC
MTAETINRIDIYAKVTARIIEDLERGVRPWFKPWSAEHAAGSITRPLRHSGEPYRGINVLMLWASAELQGFSCPLWITYRQAQELGGHVKKGEKGSPVVYSSSYSKTEADTAGTESEREIRFLKNYTVFNAEQVEGLPERFYAVTQAPKDTLTRHEQADRFFEGTGADIRGSINRAYYSVTEDYIAMPSFDAFRDGESYAASVAHELVHWTRHPKRLDRDLGRKRWGDAGYAMEELVAEIGSAFLCADLSITPEVREDHAAYIASWLEVLKNDKRAVFSAAALAQKAVDYLHSTQPRSAEAPAVAA